MHRFIGLAIVTTSLLSGCSDHEFAELIDPNPGAAPRILVEPADLSFGVVAEGAEEIRQFTISNTGNTTLHVDGIRLTGDAGFTILSYGLDFELEPLADDPTNVRVIDMAFTPAPGADLSVGLATVFSDDETNPEAPVTLEGLAPAPFLVVSPDPHDFGEEWVSIGCDQDQALTLTNEGLEDLVITDLAYLDTSGLMDVTQQPTLPLTLAPGQSSEVNVNFDAWTAGSSTGTLSVTSNDPRGVVDAVQYGEATHAGTYTEAFVQPDEMPVDILFAIDQSCSMDARLTNLQANFGTFIDTIDDVTSDWRIGVATNDDGCFNSGIIDSGTAGYFNGAVVAGSGGSYTEKLFNVASNSLTAGCNAGFMRPGALLHIVFVSDEYEQGSLTANNMMNNAISAKGTAGLVKMSTIGCPASGCGIADGTIGEYLDAVNIGGGVRLDITSSSWGAQVEDLASASLTGLGRFELQNLADPGARMTVTVNGSASSDWYYDAGSNSILFDTPPPAGASIEVTYRIVLSCN
ncbi:MAG: choice-of-anchor D domain-containing protein [Proteobacteria bacterium]|nr:choice-of-anchor D domain-containing protein [Pseudomonadota bacterium]